MRIFALLLICALPSVWAVSSCHKYDTDTACNAGAACSWCGQHCWPKGLNCPSNATHARAFNSFQTEHRRSYADTAEHAMRFGAFQDSLKIVAELNGNEQDTAVYGVTRWSDRTAGEKALKCGGVRKTGRYLKQDRNTYPLTSSEGSHVWDGTCYAGKKFPDMCKGPLPSAVDWEKLGAITPVQDQGKCGNCFTFGATCDFESAWFLAGNPLVKLSEQQITSCDHNGDDGGCGGGGTNLDTDEWVTKNGGIASEASYPYCSGKYKCKGDSKKEKKNGVCKKGPFAPKAVAKFSGGYQVSGGASDCDWCDKQPVNETRVMEHLARAGPVTIAINSNGPLENYNKGIMDPWHITCLGFMPFLDHQIAIVGYGEEDGKKYWKLRNSWGTDWGEKGYGRIIRGKNMCGVVSDATHVKV